MESSPKKKQIRFKKTLNSEQASRWIEISERLGFRRRGLELFVQRKHGFDGELNVNTDGFCKLIDFLFNYYLEMDNKNNEKIRLMIEKYNRLELGLKNLKLEKTLVTELKDLRNEIEGW